MHMRPIILNPILTYARLAWPPVLVGQARKPVFNSLTPVLMNDHSSIKFFCMTSYFNSHVFMVGNKQLGLTPLNP